ESRTRATTRLIAPTGTLVTPSQAGPLLHPRTPPPRSLPPVLHRGPDRRLPISAGTATLARQIAARPPLARPGARPSHAPGPPARQSRRSGRGRRDRRHADQEPDGVRLRAHPGATAARPRARSHARLSGHPRPRLRQDLLPGDGGARRREELPEVPAAGERPAR